MWDVRRWLRRNFGEVYIERSGRIGVFLWIKKREGRFGKFSKLII